MRFIWPWVRRASLNVKKQEVRQLKLSLSVADSSKQFWKERSDEKSKRIRELEEERDNWRKEGYK